MVAARSTSELRDLIHSERKPEENQKLMERLLVSFAVFFEKDHSDKVKAGVIESYMRALSDLPAWSVLRALDDWDKIGGYRPVPSKIRELAEVRIKVVTDELRMRREEIEKAEAAASRGPRASPEAVAEILRGAGFGFSMARKDETNGS